MRRKMWRTHQQGLLRRRARAPDRARTGCRDGLRACARKNGAARHTRWRAWFIGHLVRHTAWRKLWRSHLQRPARRPRELRGGGNRSLRSSGESRAAALPQSPAGVRGQGGASHGGHACPPASGSASGSWCNEQPKVTGTRGCRRSHIFVGARELRIFARPRLGCAAPPRAAQQRAHTQMATRASATPRTRLRAASQSHTDKTSCQAVQDHDSHWAQWWLNANGCAWWCRGGRCGADAATTRALPPPVGSLAASSLAQLAAQLAAAPDLGQRLAGRTHAPLGEPGQPRSAATRSVHGLARPLAKKPTPPPPSRPALRASFTWGASAGCV